MESLEEILNGGKAGYVSIPLRGSWFGKQRQYVGADDQQGLMGRVGVLLLPSPRKNRTSKLSKHPALANPERHQRLNTSSG